VRLVRYDGKDIKLSEHDWEQLLNRFDARLAHVNIFGYYCIPIPALCRRYGYRCNNCPLGKENTGVSRCRHLFDTIIGSELSPYVHLFESVVLWSQKFDPLGRQALEKVRETLYHCVVR
jgi:hypothetical protein